MNVLVTGAAGFIGSWTVDALVAAGHRVRATDRPGVALPPLRCPPAECIGADLLDAEAVRCVLQDIDVVVHAAAVHDIARPPSRLDGPDVRTVSILCREAVAARIRRVVLLSTVGVYGLPGRIPCDEATPKRPRNPYERTKWRGERVARSYARNLGLPLVVLRPALVYGPRSRHGLALLVGMLALWAQGRGSRALPLVRRGPLTHHVHAEDVARAVVLALGEPRMLGRAFNVADAQPVSSEAMMRALCDALDIRARPVLFAAFYRALLGALRAVPPRFLIDPLDRRLGAGWERLVPPGRSRGGLDVRFDRGWLETMRHDHVYDTSAIRAMGFAPRHPDFHRGIAETIGWYREAGWIPA